MKKAIARQISEEIFYKPATNNQANNSIEEGAELIERYAQKRVNEVLDKAAEELNQLEPYNPKHLEPQSGLDSITVQSIEAKYERFLEVKQSILKLKNNEK